ncbi:hypothetical protein EV363DRAFT_1170815, partial [Boletus edulis]
RLSAHGEAALNKLTIHTTLIPVFTEWAKAKLNRSSWKDALLPAVDISISFHSRYRYGIDIAG